MNKSIFFGALTFIFLHLVSRYVFEPMHLYYELWWLDIPMHIVGGFLVGLIFLNLIQEKIFPYSYRSAIFVFCLGAITWEFYEYARGVVDITHAYWPYDTAKDIINGIMGFSLPFIFKKYSHKLSS